MITDSWLIRLQNGSAYIWKRKYFLGLVAVPWALHGGTNIIRTPDCNTDVLTAAFDYISDRTPEANVTVKLEQKQ